MTGTRGPAEALRPGPTTSPPAETAALPTAVGSVPTGVGPFPTGVAVPGNGLAPPGAGREADRPEAASGRRDATTNGEAARNGLRSGTGTTGPRLVALDIDGTLMSHSGSIAETVVRAVARVRAAGDHVVLATGRSALSTLGVARHLGLTTGPAVVSNGAVRLALDPAELIGYRIEQMTTFDPAAAVALLRAELPGAAFAVEDPGRGFLITRPFPDGELDGEQTVVSLEEIASRPATRLIVRSPEHTSADFHHLVERVGLHEVEYAVGWVAWLDLNPPGVSKGTALEELRRSLGVAAADTVAIGDGRNDLDMLRWAARGVAMGNADDVTRAAADEVTAHVDDDGAVRVLDSLLG